MKKKKMILAAPTIASSVAESFRDSSMPSWRPVTATLSSSATSASLATWRAGSWCSVAIAARRSRVAWGACCCPWCWSECSPVAGSGSQACMSDRRWRRSSASNCRSNLICHRRSNIVKKLNECFYIALDRSKRFTLNLLADLFIPSPTWLLWEAF